MSLQPTFIETPEDAITCANLLILHINADPHSSVVQCEFETPAEFRVKDASDIIVEVLNGSNVVETRSVTTNVSEGGSHPGRRFTISATKIS